MYEEESEWFPELLRKADLDNARLARRYEEEAGRYLGGGGAVSPTLRTTV